MHEGITNWPSLPRGHRTRTLIIKRTRGAIPTDIGIVSRGQSIKIFWQPLVLVDLIGGCIEALMGP